MSFTKRRPRAMFSGVAASASSLRALARSETLSTRKVSVGRRPESARSIAARASSIGRPCIELEVSTTNTSSRGITSSSDTERRGWSASEKCPA